MPTPDRTTIKAATQALTAVMRANLVDAPPTPSKPFRRVAVGTQGVTEFPRPFLTLRLDRTSPIGTTDGDKLLRVTMDLRVVTDMTDADGHAVMLDHIGAVDDHLDSLIDTGVIEGADGFDDRGWSIEYPKATAGARVAVATAQQTFVVRVERGQNRQPAP